MEYGIKIWYENKNMDFRFLNFQSCGLMKTFQFAK